MNKIGIISAILLIFGFFILFSTKDDKTNKIDNFEITTPTKIDNKQQKSNTKQKIVNYKNNKKHIKKEIKKAKTITKKEYIKDEKVDVKQYIKIGKIPNIKETKASKIDKSYNTNKKISSNNFIVKKEKILNSIGRDDVKPLFKKWKKIGSTYYNVYYVKPKVDPEVAQIQPPSIPTVTKVNVKGKDITIALPSGDIEAYVVTKEENSSEVESESINTESEIMAPPQIGQ